MGNRANPGIGLYFGSFNPIHNGHLAIADHILAHATLEAIWFVVSPQNPLKKTDDLADDLTRLDMVKSAISGNKKYRACDIEFALHRPSYTINTLDLLKEKYPGYRFALILGEDNLRTFHKWKDYKKIADGYDLLVYPRKKESEAGTIKPAQEKFPRLQLFNSPLINISSTRIRNMIQHGENVTGLIPSGVYGIIKEHALYRAH